MHSELDVIAARTLELRHDDGTSTPVVVLIGRPYQVDDIECRCEYDIRGLSKPRRFHASGEDGIQALWLALVMSGSDLQTSADAKRHLSPKGNLVASLGNRRWGNRARIDPNLTRLGPLGSGNGLGKTGSVGARAA